MKETTNKDKQSKIDDYYEKPKVCKLCETQIPYEKKTNDFCGSSCGAKFSNSLKGIKTTCLFCGNQNLKNGRKFCNQVCRAQTYKTNRIDRISGGASACLCCNSLNLKEGAKFCSVACNLKSKSDTKKKLIEDGKASNSGMVKRYLLEKFGHVCQDPACAWDFTKRQINVELEHVNGNAENNSLENCLILCPNCHSQTTTYKNRNKGKGRAYRRIRYAEGKSY